MNALEGQVRDATCNRRYRSEFAGATFVDPHDGRTWVLCGCEVTEEGPFSYCAAHDPRLHSPDPLPHPMKVR